MSTHRLRRATPALAAIACVAAVLAGCGGGDGDSARSSEGIELSGAVRTPPLEVASVTLPNATPGADGAPFTMQAPPDGLLVVYFGFTSCPDICPTTLSDIGRAVRKLPAADRDRVEVAMVTVDPDRDTGVIISSFLDHFVNGGVALRADDPAQLDAAKDAFRVVATRVPEGDGYTFEHTAVTYVIDDRGTVVVEWPFGVSPDVIAGDLGVLLARTDPAATR